jgi:hypothetical protein
LFKTEWETAHFGLCQSFNGMIKFQLVTLLVPIDDSTMAIPMAVLASAISVFLGLKSNILGTSGEKSERVGVNANDTNTPGIACGNNKLKYYFFRRKTII